MFCLNVRCGFFNDFGPELQFIQSEQNKEMNMKKEPRRKQRRKKTKV